MDYYQVLGLKREDNPDKNQIKKAYQKKALKWHPDRMKGVNKDKTDVAHKKFTEINTAYEVLSNDQKRENYDKYGDENIEVDNMWGNMGANMRANMGANMGNSNTSFSINFGGGPGGGSFTGINSLFDRHYNFLNNLSNHSNLNNNQPKEKIIKIRCTLRDLYYGITKKYNIDGKPNNILIKRGTKNGQKYQFKQRNYTLIFKVEEQKHPVFIREGNNLIYKFKRVGQVGEHDIPHLDGQKIRLILERVPKNNTQKVIVGRGMPIKNTSAFGDLIVQFY